MRPPEPLSDTHDTNGFECGNSDLNGWLTRRAPDSEAKSARTYVVTLEQRVIAYYCLEAGAVMRDQLPAAKLRKGLPEQVPIVVIGRLAVDRRYQSRGLGKSLLKDAIIRSLQASDLVGIRAIIVHAIDDNAVAFYRKFGFVHSSLNERTLLLPVETARLALLS
jgi:ribosomal protein S18 acetylase RimI-like enzyme